MATTFSDLESLQAQLGQEIATTGWMPVEQGRINLFADATGDHQWIHLDAERAAQGPFGTTIAHGFLTLSLIPAMLESSMTIEGPKMTVNYGLNKVRFPSPVPVNSELQGKIALKEFKPLGDEGAQCVYEVTINRRGSDKPVCVAESVMRYYN